MRFVMEVIIIDGFLEQVKISVKGIIICIVNSGFVPTQFEPFLWINLDGDL